MFGRFSLCRRCCAGAETCFNYTDSLAADTDWSEESGSWTFNSGSGGFVAVSDSDAQLIYQAVDAAILTEVPYAFFAEITTGGTDDYRRNRIIFNWQDADNYWFGESIDEPSGGNSIVTVNLGRVVSGVEEILETDSLGPVGVSGRTTTLVVCYEAGIVSVSGTKSGSPSLFPEVYTTVTLVVDAMYGIGTGDQTGFDSTRLDNWSLTILLDAEDHACVDCGLPVLEACAACEEGHAAAEYSLEVAGFSIGTCGDCEALNGTFTLTHDTGCTWRSAEITDICGATVQYRLDIDSGDGIRISLEIVDPASGDLYSWLATTDDDGGAPWSCLRWTDLQLDEDTGDDIGCGPVPDTVSLTAVRPW